MVKWKAFERINKKFKEENTPTNTNITVTYTSKDGGKYIEKCRVENFLTSMWNIWDNTNISTISIFLTDKKQRIAIPVFQYASISKDIELCPPESSNHIIRNFRKINKNKRIIYHNMMLADLFEYSFFDFNVGGSSNVTKNSKD